MKPLKLFFIFLLFVVIAGGILTLVLPTHQQINRSVTINAPASTIYENISHLENFNKWSVWNQQDSTMVHTMSGTDGTVGASTSWNGSAEISGEGKMTIIGLEPNKSVSHDIEFIAPRKGSAVSNISMKEDVNSTVVTWNFKMETPRPWNIFNLIYNMEKQMGKDFENGLNALKKISESKN